MSCGEMRELKPEPSLPLSQPSNLGGHFHQLCRYSVASIGQLLREEQRSLKPKNIYSTLWYLDTGKLTLLQAYSTTTNRNGKSKKENQVTRSR